MVAKTSASLGKSLLIALGLVLLAVTSVLIINANQQNQDIRSHAAAYACLAQGATCGGVGYKGVGGCCAGMSCTIVPNSDKYVCSKAPATPTPPNCINLGGSCGPGTVHTCCSPGSCSSANSDAGKCVLSPQCIAHNQICQFEGGYNCCGGLKCDALSAACKTNNEIISEQIDYAVCNNHCDNPFCKNSQFCQPLTATEGPTPPPVACAKLRSNQSCNFFTMGGAPTPNDCSSCNNCPNGSEFTSFGPPLNWKCK